MEGKRTVLIIDDEPKTTTYFSTLLQDHGFIAHVANDADQGLAQLDKVRPDVILLDLVMPWKTGINLFRKLKKDQRYQDIPVIIVTGIQEDFTENHKEFFTNLKLDRPSAYLEKPVNPESLIRTVEQSLQVNH